MFIQAVFIITELYSVYVWKGPSYPTFLLRHGRPRAHCTGLVPDDQNGM